MIRRKLLSSALAGVIASAAIGGSIAASTRNNKQPTYEAAIRPNARIPMVRAIAVGNGIDDQSVMIDPQTGKLVKTVTADNKRNRREYESDDD